MDYKLILLSVTFCISILIDITIQAAHNHAINKNGHGERTEDGAYSPRDHTHHHGDDHDSSFDHEAIIGSKKDAEEFDDLPPDEAKRRLTILLDKMDRNKDKSIDRNEMYSWILRSFKSLSEEDSKDRFEDADEDEDGFVSWEEYKAEEYDFGDDDEIDMNDPDMAEEVKLMEEDRYLFRAADSNGDGKLNPKEFLSFSHPEEDLEMRPHVLNQVLKEKDKDGDEQLSFKEYIGDRGSGKDKEWLISEKDRFDTDLDKNGDNVMNKEEILAWIIPSNEEIAGDEVDHLFTGADEDMDEQLSYSEILNNHELFVGSEATDYGDHLHNLDRFEDEL